MGEGLLELKDIFDDNKITIMAGPCAIENEDFLYETAIGVKNAGAKVLRGGAFKPRTSPFDFQGLGYPALKMLKKVSEEVGLFSVTEVLDTKDVELVASYADILQIGSRNMGNTALLKEAGKTQKPILLKRGMASTIEEWILATQYISEEGNNNIIMCERGIRTFETATRNTLDLNAVALLKQKVDFPVIVDPSHGTGVRDLVNPMSCASIFAGADGLMIEVHCSPENALCDGKQSLTIKEFKILVNGLNKIASSIDKSI